LQKYVANRLRLEAGGQYTVTREEEVDRQNRTDIRLWHPNGLVATIEVKCADKWNYSELVDSLGSQLVGKYMRDRGSQYGVLLLGHSGLRGRWQTPDCEELNFNDLVELLENDAARIVSSNDYVSAISVVGVEFALAKPS